MVADAVIRARAGIKDPRRPIGSFIFLGPDRVGKTELAQDLAASLFDTDEAMIRIDMERVLEKHSGSRLIGAPPGYVGTRSVGSSPRRCGASVRGAPVRRNREGAPRRLQRAAAVLDDGRATDAQVVRWISRTP